MISCLKMVLVGKKDFKSGFLEVYGAYKLVAFRFKIIIFSKI
jgi:hypothetical protein